MGIFEAIRESHEIQRALCRKLTAGRGDSAKRQAIFLQLKVELEAHAAAEERYLYVPILMDDAGLTSSRHALAEHHEIEELCEELAVPDKSTAAWLEKAKKLSEEVRHHLKEEETKFFKVAGRILADAQKETLGKRYEKDIVRMRKKYAADYQTVEVAADGNVQTAVTKPATPAAKAKSSGSKPAAKAGKSSASQPKSAAKAQPAPKPKLAAQPKAAPKAKAAAKPKVKAKTKAK